MSRQAGEIKVWRQRYSPKIASDATAFLAGGEAVPKTVRAPSAGLDPEGEAMPAPRYSE